MSALRPDMHARFGLLTGVVLLMMACGGRADDDSDEGASGGSSSETGGRTGSGGADGSGGGIATGGSSTGGAPGTGGSGDACEAGRVSFRVTTEEPRSHCPDACAISWLTIKDVNGDEVALRSMCQTSCADCRPIACAASACPEPQPLDHALEFLWEGIDFTQSQCGEQNHSCYERSCVPPGVYQARICLTRASNDACVDPSEIDCVDFDVRWPSNEVFEITIPSPSMR